MLHTLMKSPYFIDLDTMFLMVDLNDDIIMLQDGVIFAVDENFVLTYKSYINIIYILKEDLEARGLKNINSSFKVINYIQFVQLTFKHTTQMNW
ncbi:sulfurtransferase complex subunit TusB [Buchnera aphidicola (Anoecia oenotherae)]|uniref:Sulfurtransferase complex subunit TusB n=2 Tax=Buchnera aphidicola TaxID=9 RepID=A0A4D6XVJ2_9GAMM|nr:sulfurtransferase complex subunit TusB [Buchnera aphidicola (Anoecia oenotherae)]